MTTAHGSKFDTQTYESLEACIQKSDCDALIARWEFGLKLLAERGDAARLPNGRLEELASALAISRAELKNRMQFAREYPTAEAVHFAFERHRSWSEVCARGLGSRGVPKTETHIGAMPEREMVRVEDLRPHPRNYRKHPPEQLQHLVESVKEHGLYRDVIVARDNTILAGHGLVLAAKELGYDALPVRRLDYEPSEPRALKVLAGENEIGRLAADDDRMLVEALKDINDRGGLPGTGYDEMQLVARVFVSTSRAEIKDVDAAGQWVGMPTFERQPEPVRLVLTFRSEVDRELYVAEHDVLVRKRESRTWSAHWPNRPRARPSDLIWEEDGAEHDKSGGVN